LPPPARPARLDMKPPRGIPRVEMGVAMRHCLWVALAAVVVSAGCQHGRPSQKGWNGPGERPPLDPTDPNLIGYVMPDGTWLSPDGRPLPPKD
jgi:hypothetical protein